MKRHLKNILCVISRCIFVADITSAEAGVKSITPFSPAVQEALFHDPLRLSHGDLLAFGLACWRHDAYLHTTAEPRKKHILTPWMSPIEERLCAWRTGGGKWHRYGSRVDYKKIVEDDWDESSYTGKKFVLGRLELGEEGKVHRYLGNWNNFDSELCKPPFYDNNKKLCCFGLGYIDCIGWGLCEKVVLYKVAVLHEWGLIQKNHNNSDILNGDSLECFLYYERKDGGYSLHNLTELLKFPQLLLSILNAPYGYVYNRCGHRYDCRFDLQNVMVPNIYARCTQNNGNIVFEKLPADLKEVLEKRYEEQKQQEVNKTCKKIEQ